MRTAARRKGLSFAAHMVYLDQLRPGWEGCFAYEILVGLFASFLTVALCIGHCWASNAGAQPLLSLSKTPVDSGCLGLRWLPVVCRFLKASAPSSGQIVIPGPLRSFLRMAGISQQAPKEEVLPLLAHAVRERGYAIGGARNSCPIEPVSAQARE